MSEELAFHEQIRRYHKELLTDVERDVGNIVESTFASRYTVSEVPKDTIPLTGMPSRVAYQVGRHRPAHTPLCTTDTHSSSTTSASWTPTRASTWPALSRRCAV